MRHEQARTGTTDLTVNRLLASGETSERGTAGMPSTVGIIRENVHPPALPPPYPSMITYARYRLCMHTVGEKVGRVNLEGGLRSEHLHHSAAPWIAQTGHQGKSGRVSARIVRQCLFFILRDLLIYIYYIVTRETQMSGDGRSRIVFARVSIRMHDTYQ